MGNFNCLSADYEEIKKEIKYFRTETRQLTEDFDRYFQEKSAAEADAEVVKNQRIKISSRVDKLIEKMEKTKKMD